MTAHSGGCSLYVTCKGLSSVFGVGPAEGSPVAEDTCLCELGKDEGCAVKVVPNVTFGLLLSHVCADSACDLEAVFAASESESAEFLSPSEYGFGVVEWSAEGASGCVE